MTYFPKTNEIRLSIGPRGGVIGVPNWEPVMEVDGKWWAMASDDIVLAECDTRAEAQRHVDLYRHDSERWIREDIKK